MLNLTTQTKLAPEEVIRRLKEFFGKGGLALEMTEESPYCLNFTGGGGYVNASLCLEEGKTRVDIVTQEWEYQTREFAAALKS